MPNLRDIVLARKEAGKQFEKYRKIIKCVTAGVDTADSCAVDGRNGFIWCREYGSSQGVFQVFNTGVDDRVGIPVLVGVDPRAPFRREVIRVDFETLAPWMTGDPGDYTLPNHHTSHEWPDAGYGADVVNVYQRAIVPLRCQPISYLVAAGVPTITFAPCLYMYHGKAYKYYGEDLDVSAYLPSVGNVVRVLFYLDPSTNAIAALSSDEVASGSDPDYVDPPWGVIPSAWVYLENGDTEVLENDITDARAFLTNIDFVALGSAGDIYTFIDLGDTPSSYVNKPLYEVIVSEDETELQFIHRGLNYSDANLSVPLVESELNGEFGPPSGVGAGFAAFLDPNGTHTDMFLLGSNGHNWWYLPMNMV